MTIEWKRSLADSVGSIDELLRLLRLDRASLPALADTAGILPLRVPREYLARMRPGDPADPLLRQVLPLAKEGRAAAGFSADPLDEHAAQRTPGLLTKFPGRSLLVVSGACAVHCRYCFRRHYPYAEVGDWRPAVAEVAADTTCAEVILSGGDPLTLDDGVLAGLAEALAEIPHLRRLRVHTRLPVVIPSRVDEALLSWLAGTRLQPVLVIHANHANEIDDQVGEAMTRLRATGLTLLNQSVLLRGVNDTADALCGLSERLFEVGVLPYYLHCLDRVQGAAHFEVAEDEARALVAEVRGRLPGYLVPRLVREVVGAPCKVPVDDTNRIEN